MNPDTRLFLQNQYPDLSHMLGEFISSLQRDDPLAQSQSSDRPHMPT